MRKEGVQEDIDDFEYARKHYPFFRKNSNSNRWIVPILPKYHEELFPDISNWSKGIFGDVSDSYSPVANTIKKAYLCHSPITQIARGDIIYFYRSQDRRSVECVGIVESAFHSTNPSEVMSYVSKRTVYSQFEIEQITKKDTLVILFRFLKNMEPVSRSELQERGIKFPIQTARKIEGLL